MRRLNNFVLSSLLFCSAALAGGGEALPPSRNLDPAQKLADYNTVLSIDESLVEAILQGRKYATIRLGIRDGVRHREDYQPGNGILISTKSRTEIPIIISEVSFMLYRDVGERELKAEGFDLKTTPVEQAHEELWRLMKSFYPTMTLESPVTVVYFAVRKIN